MESISNWSSRMRKKGNKAKGDSFQTETINFLKARGWLCDEAKPCRRLIMRGGRSAWMTTKEDFYGAFDILALRMEKSPVLFIQCTTDRGLLALKKRTILEAVGGWAPGRELMVATRPLGSAGIEFHTLRDTGAWSADMGGGL